MSESLTPVDIERRLIQIVTDITRAQSELRKARDWETESEIALKRARLIASHRDDCPAPVRGGVTVGQRDEWIDRQCFEAWSAQRQAETAREIAQDGLRTVLAVAETVRSLGASVRMAYQLAGTAA